MTDVLEPSASTPLDDLPPLQVLATDEHVPAPFLAYLLAACLTGAGVIHLAMVPSHMAEWTAEGWAFLASALVQLGLALGLVLRPRRWMAATAIATSVAFIGAWWFTRNAGMPFGPAEHHLEDATSVDVTCVVLEAAAIAVAGVVLVAPRLTARWNPPALVAASLIPLAALVAGAMAVASPDAAAHAGAGHAHGRDDLGLHLLSNGHHHEIVEHVLDPVTQAEHARQMAITREVAATYPTVADAEAAGYRKAGPYSPGLGSHYTKSGLEELNVDGVVDDADLRHPLSIIYDGNEADSPVAGFMYYSFSAVEPPGFVGSNDTWHTHSNVCIEVNPEGGVDSPFGADLPITQGMCEEVGGVLLPATQWMVHVWSVPGYDDVSGGVFAEVNPSLACSDGTYLRLDPEVWAQNLVNVCRSKAPGEPRYPL